MYEQPTNKRPRTEKLDLEEKDVYDLGDRYSAYEDEDSNEEASNSSEGNIGDLGSFATSTTTTVTTMDSYQPFTPGSPSVSSITPLTALYISCRNAEMPVEFLDALQYLEKVDKKKLLGVLQTISQIRSDSMGQIDSDFINSQESHGLLSKDLVALANGVKDIKIVKVDASHALRWIVHRFTTKVAIHAIEHGKRTAGVIAVGQYSLMQFLDSEVKYQPNLDITDDQFNYIMKLNKILVDWSSWTVKDCEKLSVGISTAVEVPIQIKHVNKLFYRYCIALMNVLKLKLVNGFIVAEPISGKLSAIKTFMVYNRQLRSFFASHNAAGLLTKLLGGSLMCLDEQLFSFSSLSYILTYAVDDDVVEGFEELHKQEYERFAKSRVETSLQFIYTEDTRKKADAFRQLANITAFNDMQQGNRMYRSAVHISQEYDTTLFVGPFERTIRRTYYMNHFFSDYSFIGLGSVTTPKGFYSAKSSEKYFYAIGIPEGSGATQGFKELIKGLTIPSLCRQCVIYGPVVRFEAVSTLCSVMLKHGFRGVQLLPPDQSHSQFTPICFTKTEAREKDFIKGFCVFNPDIGETVLGLIYFSIIKRVVLAERDYMMKVQLGVDNTYTGKFVNVSKLPSEIINLSVTAEVDDIQGEEDQLEVFNSGY